MKIKYQDIKGFSLIELIVAASIFVGVLAFVGGTFSLFVAKQRQQISQQLLQQEVQNFFDVIDREARTAYGETFESSGCVPVNSCIQFMNQEQKYVVSPQVAVKSEYALSGPATDGTRKINYMDKITNLPVPLTSDNVNVTDLKFSWIGVSVASDGTKNYLSGVAPRLTISVTVCEKTNSTSCLHAQTTISSRQTRPIDAP